MKRNIMALACVFCLCALCGCVSKSLQNVKTETVSLNKEFVEYAAGQPYAYGISDLKSSLSLQIDDLSKDETNAVMTVSFNGIQYAVPMSGMVGELKADKHTGYYLRLEGSFTPDAADSYIRQVSAGDTTIAAHIFYCDRDISVSLTIDDAASAVQPPISLDYGERNAALEAIAEAYSDMLKNRA